MAILAKSNGNSTFVPAPAGTHVARCYSVIDIGTHSFTWQGKTSRGRKVRISWELPEEVYTVQSGDDAGQDRPFTVAKEYTLSLSDKANLRHMLEGWRGRPFTKEEMEGFDVGKLVGAPCLVTVLHKLTGTGKTVADVSSVTKLPKKTECPAQINPSIEYSVDNGRDGVFAKLPQWLQEKIAECEEWQNRSEPESGYVPSEPPVASDDTCPF